MTKRPSNQDATPNATTAATATIRSENADLSAGGSTPVTHVPLDLYCGQ